MYLNGLLSEEIRDGHRIHYSYDSYDHLAAIQYYFEDNQTFALYYVTTNAQGDVLGLYTGAGVQVASYEYDAWGNVISMTDTTSFGIATINPIRYRGYYFDEETGWYYLQSRYYDPEIGRFINADGQLNLAESVLGINVYAYCYNNPISMSDPDGNCPEGFIGPCQGPGKCKYLIEQEAGFCGNTTSTSALDAINYFSTLTGLVTDTAKFALSIPKTKVPAIVDTDGYIRFAPKGCGFTAPRFPNAPKALDAAGKIISGVSLAIDLGITVAENNGNTPWQKVQKGTIQIAGAGANVLVGMLAIAASNCWNPVGWGAAAACITFVGINVIGIIAIAYVEESLYDLYGIK